MGHHTKAGRMVWKPTTAWGPSQSSQAKMRNQAMCTFQSRQKESIATQAHIHSTCFSGKKNKAPDQGTLPSSPTEWKCRSTDVSRLFKLRKYSVCRAAFLLAPRKKNWCRKLTSNFSGNYTQLCQHTTQTTVLNSAHRQKKKPETHRGGQAGLS